MQHLANFLSLFSNLFLTHSFLISGYLVLYQWCQSHVLRQKKWMKICRNFFFEEWLLEMKNMVRQIKEVWSAGLDLKRESRSLVVVGDLQSERDLFRRAITVFVCVHSVCYNFCKCCILINCTGILISGLAAELAKQIQAAGQLTSGSVL